MKKQKHSKETTKEKQEKVDIWMRQFAELLLKNYRSMTPEQRKGFTEKATNNE